MKKSKLLLCLSALMLAAPLAACGEKKDIVDPNATIELNRTGLVVCENGTITLKAETKNGEGSVQWSSDNEAVATVKDGVVKGVKEGNAVITATYAGHTATCAVEVVKVTLSAVNENTNIHTFKTNVLNAKGEFLGETSNIMNVGQHNAFVMTPVISLLDSEYSEVPQEAWGFDYTYTLEEYVNGEYKTPNTTYADFDVREAKFSFKESAIGKQLRLSITLGGLTSAQIATNNYTHTVEVSVLKGYNVYTANELAYFNDPTMEYGRQGHAKLTYAEYNTAWKTFRKAQGLDENYVAENIFLQSNIKIKDVNLPSEFFFKNASEGGAVGGLKDATDVYMRNGEDFIFNGNYFNIDTTEVTTCGNCSQPEDNISHSTLFKTVEIRSAKAEKDVIDTKIEFKNCSYFGNGPRTNDEAKRLGLIFIKVANDDADNKIVSKANFSNFNVQGAVISFYQENGPTALTIEHCKVTEGYANGLYVYRHGELMIKSSELTNFGGPIIVTQVDAEYGPGVSITASKDSKLENWVTGNEPWFVNTGANQAIASIQQANALFTPFGKSFIKESGESKLMNFVLVNRGTAPTVTYTVEGETAMGALTTDDNATKIKDLLDRGEMVFMTEKGGAAHFSDPTYGLIDDFHGETQYLSTAEHAFDPIYRADYLNFEMYNPMFGYISMVFGYINL